MDLEHSKRYLDGLFNIIPSILISINRNYEIQKYNTQAVKMFKDLSIKKKIFVSLPCMNQYKSYIDKALLTGDSEKVIKTKLFNNEKYYNIYVYPFKFKNDTEILIFIEDITNIVNKEIQLQQFDKINIVKNMAHGIAHDFNNILGGILGTTSLVKYSLKSDNYNKDKLYNNIITIEDSANIAKETINNLFLLSNKNLKDKDYFSIKESLNKVVDICKNSFDKSIYINFDIKSSFTDCCIYGYKNNIEQSILNLCINAMHAMTIMKEDEIGGELSIKCKSNFPNNQIFIKSNYDILNNYNQEKKYIQILIEDTGIGIDKKIINKIFEPFYTSKKRSKGLGLGLSMVLNMIQQNNCLLKIFSKKNIGTRFEIYFPIVDDEIMKKETKYLTTDLSKLNKEHNKTVLIADDELVILNVLSNMLINLGFNILKSTNGQELIDTYEKNKENIDLIITDLIMPIKSGKDAIEFIRKENKDIQIILSSGNLLDERIKKIEKYNISFLAKPFTIEKLYNKLNEINIFKEE